MRAIFRIQKQAQFSVISNAVLRDRSLTFQARGMLGYLFSLPDDWRINTKHLISQSPAGRDAVYSVLSELKKAGYIETITERGENGKVTGLVYLVRENPEKPETENPEAVVKTVKTKPVKADSPETDIPDPAKPDTEKPDHTNTDKDKKTEKTTKTESASVSSSLPPDDLLSLIPDAVEKTEQLKALVRKHVGKSGPEVVKEAILYTNERKPKQYKSYLGQCLDKGWSEGYGADIEKTSRESQKARSRAESILMAMTEEQRERLAGELELWLVNPNEKTELWKNGVLSEKIRPKVLKYLSR